MLNSQINAIELYIYSLINEKEDILSVEWL